MPLPPKPRFTDTEAETQRASSEKARHAGALLDSFEGLPSAGARADLVELASLFAIAGSLRRTILRVVRAIVTGD